MKVFVDTISKEAVLILFDGKKIIKEKKFEILGNEFSNFFDILSNFLKSNKIGFEDIKGYIIVNGPGGFTGTRIISLIFNTIEFVYKKPMMSIDYFKMLEYMGNTYPMAIKANRGEYLIKDSKNNEPYILKNNEILEGEYCGVWDENDFENKNILFKNSFLYNKLIENIDFNFSNNRINPFYIKKPNIT